MIKNQQKDFIDAYDKYADAIYRYCFFRVYSKNLAEELTQETFMRMWGYLSKGKEVENMQAFLYRVARNLIVDSYRKAETRGKKEQSFNELLDYKKESLEPSYNGKEDVERDTLLGEVVEAIKKLPQGYRDVLIMHYMEGLSPKEIAEILNTNPNNISVKIYKAIKKLNLYIC